MTVDSVAWSSRLQAFIPQSCHGRARDNVDCHVLIRSCTDILPSTPSHATGVGSS